MPDTDVPEVAQPTTQSSSSSSTAPPPIDSAPQGIEDDIALSVPAVDDDASAQGGAEDGRYVKSHGSS